MKEPSGFMVTRERLVEPRSIASPKSRIFTTVKVCAVTVLGRLIRLMINKRAQMDLVTCFLFVFDFEGCIVTSCFLLRYVVIHRLGQGVVCVCLGL